MPPRETLPACTLQLALRAYWLRSLKTFCFVFLTWKKNDFVFFRIFFLIFSSILETTCKFGLTRLGRERTSQLLTLASQSHLHASERKVESLGRFSSTEIFSRLSLDVKEEAARTLERAESQTSSAGLPVAGRHLSGRMMMMVMMMMIMMMMMVMMKCMSVTFLFIPS